MQMSWKHPGKSARINCEEKELGYITVVHPQVSRKVDNKLKMAVAEINLNKLNSIKERFEKYVQPSKYPGVDMDFSFVVDEKIQYKDVLSHLEDFESELVESIEFMDIYKGKGLDDAMKSLTFKIHISSPEHTLSSEEIDGVFDSVVSHMKDRGYNLR